MQLDVKTMFVVTIAVTVLLGMLLIYVWYQQRKVTALAWWGLAHMVASTGVWLIGLRGAVSDFWSIEMSNALLFIAAGMTWTGARLFDGNRVSPVGVLGGAVAWLLATRLTPFLATPHAPVVFSSMIIAAYTFASAIEFWRGRQQDNLLSRLPLIVMLSMHGAVYLARVPLAMMIPGPKTEIFFSTAWFGVIGLESLLYMIATAFVLLAMAKERTEHEHKMAASIDPLTGIANRRSLLETAVRSLKQRSRTPQPVSALLFDLDRFKSINDRYGHAVGDRVLRCFADIAVTELRSTDLLGRIGGEEFGAVLFGADDVSAAATAERIRVAFAATRPGDASGQVSVSVGVASVAAHESTDIETLFARADEALYVAKARGRNRVEVADGYSVRDWSRPRVLQETGMAGVTLPDPRLVSAVASPGIVPGAELGQTMRTTAIQGG
jgi:diguanylate cyclase (GGDEF)-like protein